MFARYAGIGVGHHAQYEFPTSLHPDDDQYNGAGGAEHSDCSSHDHGTNSRGETLPDEAHGENYRNLVEESEEDEMDEEDEEDESEAEDVETDEETGSDEDEDELDEDTDELYGPAAFKF